MYKICTYRHLKVRLGVAKVSLCISIHVVFCFFWCYLTLFKVDLVFSAYDYLATLNPDSQHKKVKAEYAMHR